MTTMTTSTTTAPATASLDEQIATHVDYNNRWISTTLDDLNISHTPLNYTDEDGEEIDCSSNCCTLYDLGGGLGIVLDDGYAGIVGLPESGEYVDRVTDRADVIFVTRQLYRTTSDDRRAEILAQLEAPTGEE